MKIEPHLSAIVDTGSSPTAGITKSVERSTDSRDFNRIFQEESDKAASKQQIVNVDPTAGGVDKQLPDLLQKGKQIASSVSDTGSNLRDLHRKYDPGDPLGQALIVKDFVESKQKSVTLQMAATALKDTKESINTLVRA
jgi:hypothetical protein